MPSTNTEYKYYDWEQGQPGFLFEKQGERVFFSIVDSITTLGTGDPEWQRVEFGYRDFVDQYRRMRADFVALILQSVPVNGHLWLAALQKDAEASADRRNDW